MPQAVFANEFEFFGPDGLSQSVAAHVPDDFAGDASTTGVVAVGGTVTGNIEDPGDRDWFAITLTEGQTVQIAQNGLGLSDPLLQLRDASGNLVASNDDGGPGLDSLITFTALSGGVYYIDAGAFGSNAGTYQIVVTEVPRVTYDPLDTITWGTELSDSNVTVYFGVAGFAADGFTSEGFNAYEISRFRAAFDELEAVTGLTFTFVNSPVGADFRMILDTNEMGTGLLGQFYPPGNGSLSGLGVFNGAEWDRTAGGTLESGGLGYQTITHEILHGLGLAHPHDTGGTSDIMPGVSGPFNSFGQDGLNQGIFTTLSYNRGFNLGEAGTGMSFDYVYGAEAGPMALDIALLQRIYGANTTTAGGNDVYVLDGANGVGTHWQSIWDTGGTDEIRYTGALDVSIDLRAATLLGEAGGGGFLSRATGIAGGFTIAAGVVIENATAGSGDDTLIGNAANNILNGGGGNDLLRGGAGADQHIGGAGIDTVDYTGSRGSLRVDLMFAEINTNIAAGDTYDGIENLIGSQGFDNLRGNLGDNLIQGMANVDYIFGRRGTDTLEGGIGDDVLFGGLGADVLRGGMHRDRAQYSESLTALVLDLMNSGNNTGEAAGDTYDSIEDLAGGQFADLIYGDLGDNRLFGREGADQLYGRAGNDYLNGGAHADRLDGGAGDDTLRGGTHNDTFVFNGGNDVVEDFTRAHADRIAIQASVITAVAGMTAQQVVDTYASVVGGQVVFNFGGGNTLTLESLNTLTGLADDVLIF
tara:strand:+ start:127299 stop:129563 length:2265 start_codon:yes stop_codon:yes gene_type:complete